MLVSLDFFKSIVGKIIDDVKMLKNSIDALQPKINGSPGQVVGFDANGHIVSTEETDPTVPDWAKQPQKPSYTAQEVGALPDTTKIPSALSDLSDDDTHRTVTDVEKTEWSSKSNFSGDYNDLSNIPSGLPNPSALTFSGAFIGSYDGSNSLNVEIPETVTDEHINSLINTALGEVENGSY